MTNRIRFLALLLSLALALLAAPASSQSEEEGPGSAGDAIEDIVDGIDPSDPDAPIDPSDPDAPIDPSDPDAPVDPSDPDAPVDPFDSDEPSEPDVEGDPVEPDSPVEPASDPEGEIDPSDPEGEIDPADPDPADPGLAVPAPADSEGDIDLPPVEPDEEGGFAEIQLIPDPVPKPGRWKVTNKVGTVACTGTAGGREGVIVQKIPRSTETGRIKVRDEGRTLIGTKLAQGQSAPLRLTWDPESERYKGSVRAAAPGGRTKIKFDFRVVSQNRLEGELIADVRVNAGGVKSNCTVGRAVSLKRR